MAGRAQRRVAQRQEQLRMAAVTQPESKGSDEDEDEDEQEDIRPVRKAQPSAFAMLEVEEAESEDEQEEEVAQTRPPAPKPVQAPSSSKQKKKKKKGGKAPPPAEDDDEFGDLALQPEATSETSDQSKALPSLSVLQDAYRLLFKVDTRHLNSNAELRRLFGSRIVNTPQATGSPRRGAPIRRAKSILVEPSPDWGIIESAGINMEFLGTHLGASQFGYVYSNAYRDVQLQFLNLVETLDPNSIMQLHRLYPFHVESLLVLSDVCRHSGDHAMATDLVERALFVLERGFHPLFNVANGLSRLPYARVENRSLYLALFRQILSLGNRGCWRTGLEFCKLLMSLDPTTDPLGVLLAIDFYALRAGEHEYFLSLYETLVVAKELFFLPNLRYSYALATFRREAAAGDDEHAVSSVLLLEAMTAFPSVVPLLVEACGAAALPRSFNSMVQAATCPPSLHMLCVVMVERGSSLWKEPEVLEWWRGVALGLLERPDGVAEMDDFRRTSFRGTPLSIYRHVVISDYKKSSTLVPPEVASSGFRSYDPFPPADSYTHYQVPLNYQGMGSRPQFEEESVASVVQSFLMSFLPVPADQAARGMQQVAQMPVQLLDALRNMRLPAGNAAENNDEVEFADQDNGDNDWEEEEGAE